MKPLRLPWTGRNVPYALIDVIRGCNCICKTCYNREHPRAKPLDEIARELDVIFAERRVEFVGILGGEPLLHPDLVRIVEMIKARGVGAVLLTNGILWDADRARALAAAGLVMTYFHIQSGQQRPDLAADATPDDVARLAAEKTAIAAAAGIDSAVSTTVRATEPERIAEVLGAFRRNPSSSHAFLTLERSMDTIDAGVEAFGKTNSMEALVRVLRPLGWRPFVFIGGRHDPQRLRWIVCHSYQRIGNDGRETGFVTVPPSGFEKLMFALLRLFRRHLPLRSDPPRGAVLVRLALNALTGGPLKNLLFVFGTLFRGERLVRKNIIAEAFPDLLSDGSAECCEPCLDSVVVNGRLVPVCLADTRFVKGDAPCGK